MLGAREGFDFFSSFLHRACLVSERPLDPRQFELTKRGYMRSELVYSASTKIGNRFLLATVTMRAVKRLHVISTRTEDTANKVLADITTGRFIEVKPAPLKPLPPIDVLLITPAA
jgi:hypothetical protein